MRPGEHLEPARPMTEMTPTQVIARMESVRRRE
jgi:hypothetical protein